ncbi:MAG: hypothetical protein U1E73_05405 [Planctomycetota bacterium]
MTNRSDETTGWTAGAMVFSGRPDPQWTLPPRVAAMLLALWERAPALADAPSVPTRLGYRACWARAPSGVRFVAVSGAILRESSMGRKEARGDMGREFEQAVIASAPPDALPPGAGDVPARGPR